MLQCHLCAWWLEQEIIGSVNQQRFRLVTRKEPCNRKDDGRGGWGGGGLFGCTWYQKLIWWKQGRELNPALGQATAFGQYPHCHSSWPFSYFCEHNMSWEISGVKDWSQYPALKRCQRTWFYLITWNELLDVLRFPNCICLDLRP